MEGRYWPSLEFCLCSWGRATHQDGIAACIQKKSHAYFIPCYIARNNSSYMPMCRGLWLRCACRHFLRIRKLRAVLLIDCYRPRMPSMVIARTTDSS